MVEPQRDANGVAIPYDDEDIEAADGLIRHVHPTQLIYDDNKQCQRVSSGAFSPSQGINGGMSIDLERKLLDNGKDQLAMVPSENHAAVRLIAGKMRELGHQVGSNPLPENPYHGEVWISGGSKSQRKRAQRSIRDTAEILRMPVPTS